MDNKMRRATDKHTTFAEVAMILIGASAFVYAVLLMAERVG